MSSSGLVFRQANVSDVAEIASINEFWNQRFELGDRGGGFLRNRYSVEELRVLVEDGSVVVASQEGLVCGYYLANDRIIRTISSERRMLVEGLIGEGRLQPGRYVMQAQAGVARNTSGAVLVGDYCLSLGARTPSLGLYSRGRYHGNDGSKLAHLRSGWNVVAPASE